MNDPQAQWETARMLRAAGVDATLTPDGVTPPRGEIPLPATTKAFLASVSEEDVTPPHVQAANDAPSLYQRLQLARHAVGARRILPCFDTVPCFLQPGCCQVEKSWIPPDIKFTPPIVTRIPRVKFCLNPFGAGVTGDLEVSTTNLSKPGEQLTTTTCRCSGGSSKEARRTIPGSDYIDALRATQAPIMKEIDERLADLVNNFSNLRPSVEATSAASFRKAGIVDLVRSMWDRFRTGGINIKADIESIVTWTWLGKKNTKIIRHRVEAWVPVAKVEYDVTCRV